MTTFADLHRPGAPLLLPNVWDVASAQAMVRAGFRALGTTSLGVAAAAGQPDGDDLTAAGTVALVRRLRGLGCMVSADIERGSVETAVAVAEAGGVGVNVEDAMGDPEAHADLVRRIKRAAPGLFVNARTDTHWLRDGTAGEAIQRVRRYADAGADGVFVPGLADAADIAAVAQAVEVPLNVLYLPGKSTLAELAALGVARVSLGSLPFRAALQAAVDTAVAVRDGVPTGAGLPTYREVNG
ncbi:isocitrate lyase/phosphoenolpyruvate mutase family protein [Dactylosporangium sp. AC04546]|uniref:isocitrate lyase/PEP mutase family protein n=1 Tax=Dactylosporangium sp. AC04546 TaxID=2862460 RepID=UPI001EDFF9B4|nr:isocitrate lyase/phosphoenolpyruvate mutase family protein [Dactylosporangium sp. AC04546]WVK85797.1 isocitrate lyase/phosphoenolpyruvate mutase family protein [Dactylosporangium sp. AC04546]